MKALTNNRLLFSVPLKIWAEKGHRNARFVFLSRNSIQSGDEFYFISRISTKLASEKPLLLPPVLCGKKNPS